MGQLPCLSFSKAGKLTKFGGLALVVNVHLIAKGEDSPFFLPLLVPCRGTPVAGHTHGHLLCSPGWQWRDLLCSGRHGHNAEHLPRVGECRPRVAYGLAVRSSCYRNQWQLSQSMQPCSKISVLPLAVILYMGNGEPGNTKSLSCLDTVSNQKLDSGKSLGMRLSNLHKVVKYKGGTLSPDPYLV